MDFKSLLQSMTSLSEAETKVTKTGKVHKGDYGTAYDGDDEKKPAASTEKRGRGRPKKGADDSGEVKSYDTKSLGSVFGGGQKPKKDIGKVSKKHSLKEYMESAAQLKKLESVMEGMFGGVDHNLTAEQLAKLARVIKSVQTPEQFAVAQKYAKRMAGTIMNRQHDDMGFGSGMKSNMGVSRDIQSDLKAKARELGIEYTALEEEDQVQIKPAQQNTQVISQGNKTLGTVTNPQLANQIKQAIGQGQMSLTGDDENQMNEGAEAKKFNVVKDGKVTKTFTSMAKAKDYAAKFGGKIKAAEKIEEAKPDFLDVDKDKNKKESFKKAVKDKETKKVDEAAKPDFLDVDKDKNKKESFKKAVKDKEAKKKVAEGRDHIASAYLDEEVAKILAREKPGMDTVKSNDAFYSAIYHELIQLGLMPKAARGKLADEDFIADVASAYSHYQTNPTLDEGSIEDHTQHGMDATPSKFVAVPTKQEPTPFRTDPIQATTDRAINFISGLRKPTNPFSESKTMKDMQVESWASQLDSLLNEGITVSSSQGQQGAPDSVSVTASDNDAQQLMQVLRSAGIGGFGAGEVQPQADAYGVISQGEEESTGTGTAPQQAPGVVGDDGDMLSMLKKMSGISDAPAQGGEEGGQDYEDEEGQEAGALEPTSGDEEGSEEEQDSDDEEGSEEDEEQTDEGNAFTGKLKQTPQGQDFKMGDKSYKDTSSIEEGDGHECNECGMMESSCECDHDQVNEYANDAGGDAMGDAQLMKLKALLSVGNDLHRMKTSQAMGNPVRVTESKQMINEWKKLSGI